MEETRLHIEHWHQWALPAHGLQIETIDAHVCGQPLRLILSGIPVPKGKTVLEKCRHVLKDFDHLRTALLLEPRGHTDMYAAILAPAQRADSHYSVLFLHRSGMCPISGHGIIAVATLCLEAQLLEMKAPETLIRLDTPAGLVRVYATMNDNRVATVFFENVPSFALGQGFIVEVPRLGKVVFAAAYGGEFYAYVDAAALKLDLSGANFNQVSHLGMTIGKAISDQFEFPHPTEPSLGVLAGVVFHANPVRRRGVEIDQRLVCVYTDGAIDRSPSGTGLSGWLALLYAEGSVELEQAYVAEGILGGTMTGKLAHTGVMVGENKAVIVEIEGRAHLTGRHCFFVGGDDPLRDGFLI